MGILTLIKTLTADGDSSLSFVDGTSSVVLDSTYDEYMFVFTDIGPATDNVRFQFQVNATDDAGGGYDTSTITTATWDGHASEGEDAGAIEYQAGHDQANGTAFQRIIGGVGSDADQSCAGVMHLFNPSSTTYVKHFYAHTIHSQANDIVCNYFISGYINDTTAIDEIQFKMSSGNFDGVIQLYGIS